MPSVKKNQSRKKRRQYEYIQTDSHSINKLPSTSLVKKERQKLASRSDSDKVYNKVIK